MFGRHWVASVVVPRAAWFSIPAVLLTGLALTLSAPAPAFAQDPCRQDDPPPPPECWSVSVTPQGGVTATRSANSGGYSELFVVQNTGLFDTYTITCAGSANVTCTGVSPNSVDGSATVTAFYSVGGPGDGTLTVCATGSNASDCGWVTVPVQSFNVAVTPDGGAGGTTPTRVPNTGGYTGDFTVQNTGSGSETYTFTCTSSANVTCGTVGPTSATIGSGLSRTVTVSYSVGAAGTGTLTLSAASGQSSNSGFYTVPVGQPAGAPIVDVTPYVYAKQDYRRCSHACFATLYSQSTTPYISLNTPQSVTLAYNSDRVGPRPFVHVNVTPDLSIGTPTEYRLQVKVKDAFVTFLNGENLLKFTYPGPAKVRLGGQFDAALALADTTKVYPMEIVVSALYPSGPVTTSIPTKLVVVNETNAPVAAGWTLGGIQRLYPQSDGSALITEGDGSAVYFWSVGGTFVAPAGEFSSLTGSGGWTRTYLDGSRMLFDATGRMTQLLDRFGNATTITYDGSGRVSQIKDPVNLALTLSYGATGLASIQDPGTPARTTAVTVDASRHLTAIIDPDGISTRFTTDQTHVLWKVFDRRGDSTMFGYDGGSRKLTFITYPPVRLVLSSGAISVSSPTESRYPWQQVGVPYTATASSPAAAPLADTVRARIINGRGFATTFTVNRWGSPAVVTDAVGAVDSTSYDANGLVVRTRYANGGVDAVGYNAGGLPTFMQAAGGSAVNVRYGAYAQADSIWGDGRPTIRNYIGFGGRIDSTVVGGQSKKRYTYDGRGRVISERDPEGHLLVQHTYAGTNGNLSKDSLPGGRLTTYFSDGFGRDTAVQGPESPLRRTQYDPLNRVTEFFDGVHPSPTVTAYDSLFVRSITDPKGQVYRFSYNGLGWLRQRTDPQNRTDEYDYDKNGNLKRWINRRADSLKYTYDGVDRLTNKSGSNTSAESWNYSADRRVVTATSPVSTETVYMNFAAAPDSVKTVVAGLTYWRRYRYTAAALLDSVDFAGSAVAFRARKYLYDPSFRALTQIRLAGASTVIARNKDLQDTSVTFPGGDRVTKLFYPLHNATQVSTTAPYNGTIARSISYGGAGRIAQQMVGDGSSGTKYTYDGLGRVTSDSTLALVPGQPPPPTCDGNPPPIVDEFGNSCVGEGGGSTWQVIGGAQFGYDSVGNRRDNGGQYLPGNRITAFAGCSYSTDNDGNVTARTCSTQTITFFWSTESRLDSLSTGSQRVAFKYDAGGRLARRDVNGAPQSYFLWGNDFAPFNGADRARFKGALWLGPDVDAYYMRARWYEPQTGRFLSEDPTGLGGGINPYVFAGDDPINRRDPSGLGCYYIVRIWYYVDTGEIIDVEILGYYCDDDGGGGGGGNGEQPQQPQKPDQPQQPQQQNQCPAGGLQWPVPSPYVTSPFGQRPNPFNPAATENHSGIDVRGAGGTAVGAAAGGTVTFAGPAQGFGNMVNIRHEGGFTTVYGHIGPPTVSRGAVVTAGQTIGYVAPGIAGRSTAPHLHFGLLDPQAPRMDGDRDHVHVRMGRPGRGCDDPAAAA